MTTPSDLDLLQAYLDGTLSPDEVRAVEARLKTEPALAKALVALAREEAVLAEWARSQRAMPMVPPRRSRPFRARWLAIGAAAAVLLVAGLAAVLLSLSTQSEPAAPVAAIEEVQGEVFVLTPQGETLPAQPGRELFSGEGVKTRGEESAAVVRYPDHTRLELGSDTIIRLITESVAGKKVNLSEGVIVADVVKQPDGHPMVLTTPHVEVRAQETRFSSTSLFDTTWIDPEEGRLRVTRRSDGRSVEVPSGSYLVASRSDDVPGVRPFGPQPLPPSFTKPRAVLRDNTGPVQAVAVSPDGKTVATGGWDGNVRLWDVVAPGREITVWGVRWGPVNVSPNQARAVFKGATKGIRTLAFSPDGKSLAAAADEKFIHVWDIATGNEEQAALKNRANAVAFTPDGVLVTAGGAGKTPAEVRLWMNGEQVSVLANVLREALCAAASPDGRLLAVGFPDGSVRLWDLKAGRELRSLPAHTKEVRCLAFSPDGQTLATGSRDQTVWLWNTATWTTRDLLPAHPGEVRCLAFSPDGRTLVSGGGNGMLKVWNLATGEELTTFRADKSVVAGLAFTPDGRTLVTCGWERTAKLWDAVADPRRP